MFAEERQNKISELVKKNGAVTTNELIKSFGVSVETIRRDLLALERNGDLKRVHGGAVSIGTMKGFADLSVRLEEHDEQKHELAKNAVKFINNGDIIGIDAGSTAIAFSQALKENFSDLTIVTYCMDVFEILCKYKDFKVILCGGYFMQNENTFVGELTLEILKKLHVQKGFVFPSALSIKNGVCDYQPEMYQLQRQMIAASDELYILADSSKFETNALLKLTDIDCGATYITDSLLSDELKKLYKENNINVYTGGTL